MITEANHEALNTFIDTGPGRQFLTDVFGQDYEVAIGLLEPDQILAAQFPLAKALSQFDRPGMDPRRVEIEIDFIETTFAGHHADTIASALKIGVVTVERNIKGIAALFGNKMDAEQLHSLFGEISSNRNFSTGQAAVRTGQTAIQGVFEHSHAAERQSPKQTDVEKAVADPIGTVETSSYSVPAKSPELIPVPLEDRLVRAQDIPYNGHFYVDGLVKGRNKSDLDPIREYHNQIGKFPLLTREQEVDLAKKIEAGVAAQAELDSGKNLSPTLRREFERTRRQGEEAKRTFIESNLRLVVSNAKRYIGMGVAQLDLYQEGNLGLIRAVDKFEWRKGFKFSTYATWWIRQALQTAVGEDGGRAIRIPRARQDLLKRVAVERHTFEHKYRRLPTMGQLAEICNITVITLNELLTTSFVSHSLSEQVGDSGKAEFGDFLPDKQAAAPDKIVVKSEFINTEIERMLQSLGDRERAIIRLRFGLDDGQQRTLEEVGREFGVTRERIRQLETISLGILREQRSHLSDEDIYGD